MGLFLETKRLILKTTENSDFDQLVLLRTNPDVMRYTSRGVQTKEEVQQFLDTAVSYQEKHGIGFFSVFEKRTSEFIGQAVLYHIGFNDKQPEIEIAYGLHKKYWGKGYGTELARALIHWGFEHLSVEKLVAFVHPENIASHRILQKCGMINLGIKHSYYGDLLKYEIYKNDAIELKKHDPAWLKTASLEIDHLRKILPTSYILDIQHVGSTAVPGIHAKPIIDIQIVVDSLQAIKPIAIAALKKSGYEYWADNPDTERMFFVKGMPPYGSKRTHHVHIVEPASHHFREKIQFRDYLLSHPDAADEYEKLKMNLANLHTYDREKYTDAKAQFVNDILKKANTDVVNKKIPFVIFLTGASGSGKTTLINAFNSALHDQSIACLHFDRIGVPSVEKMVSMYGSPSEWQKAMTYHWVQNILTHYQDKKIVVIEGQVNLDFIASALTGFSVKNYKIILVHCDNASRHQRLHQDRNQPELINDDMDKWAEFLKKQAVEKNVIILDTSFMNINKMVDWFLQQIETLNF